MQAYSQKLESGSPRALHPLWSVPHRYLQHAIRRGNAAIPALLYLEFKPVNEAEAASVCCFFCWNLVSNFFRARSFSSTARGKHF